MQTIKSKDKETDNRNVKMCRMLLSDAKYTAERTTSAEQAESFIILRFVFMSIVIYKG